jgi:glycosyltransferase involved in cell wall biosynthesis
MMLSIILPVYNECNRLEMCVDTLNNYLSKAFTSYEIIIVEDNSTDGSLDAAQRIAAVHNNVVLIHNDSRLGRGASLNVAIKKSSADHVIYMDVDLATDLKYVKELVDSLKNGAAVSTGSRLMKGSKVTRPLSRDIASKSYNMLIRLLLHSKIHDHQCGFKGFNKKTYSRSSILSRTAIGFGTRSCWSYARRPASKYTSSQWTGSITAVTTSTHQRSG